MIEKELLMNLLNNADMSDEENKRTIKILYQIARRRIKVSDDLIDSIDMFDDITELYDKSDYRKRRLLYVFAQGLMKG